MPIVSQKSIWFYWHIELRISVRAGNRTRVSKPSPVQ